MNKNIKLSIIVLLSITFLYFFIKILGFLPKKYIEGIKLLGSFSMLAILSGTIFAIFKDKTEKQYKDKKDYFENILLNFTKIDDFLIENYDKYSIILSILYNKVQIPSSDVDLNSLAKKMDKRTKDMLFLIYNKLCIIFEKMFLVNKDLFSNKELGIRVRLYTENVFFYEYWNLNHNLFNTNFVNFMNDKYKYLLKDGNKYNKFNRSLNISYFNDVPFIYKSSKYNGLYY
jgi:hypothetical protein